jgi:RPA family protein
MTTPPQTAGVPVVHNGQEIYDAIMRTIEPELCSEMIPLLNEKCKNETDDQKKARAERYTKASAEYDKRAAEFFAEVSAEVNTLKRKAFSSAEQKNRSEEATKMQQLESLINS